MEGIEIRICLIGDFSEQLDEGLKNIAHNISTNLSNINDLILLKINIKNPYDLLNISQIKEFRPDIIHFLPGPTNKSLLYLRILNIILKKRAKIVLSAIHPMFSDLFLIIFGLKPDHVFCSSERFYNRMKNLGIATSLLPNGVDLERFKPVGSIEKIRLRKKYDLDIEKFTVLHVGHLMKKRNLGIFEDITEKNQVILIGSSYIKTERSLMRSLRNAGCIIRIGYIQNIEEFYQLSDCYAFPVDSCDTILTPLSILEAMSCNLPIVSIDNEGIKTFFEEGNGLFLENNKEEMIETIETIKKREISVLNRKKIEEYSWKNIATNIASTYERLIQA